MLSLPDDWNYNMQGLASLSRDGIDSIRSAIKELEHHGYVQRNIVRNEYGLFTYKFNIGLSGTINNVPAVV